MSDKWSVHRRIGILHCCRTVKPRQKSTRRVFRCTMTFQFSAKRSERGSLLSPLDAVASSAGGINRCATTLPPVGPSVILE